MRVLVITGFNQCGVVTVRSLARAGYEVEVAVTLAKRRWRSQQWFVSRHAKRRVLVAHPREDVKQFQQQILELCRQRKYDVVLAAGEEATLALAAIQTELPPPTTTPFDSWANVALVHDKFRLHRTLRDAGFLVPRLYEYAAIEQLSAMNFDFPVVVKPRKHSGAKSGTRYVLDRAQLMKTVQEFHHRPTTDPSISDFSFPVIQEYIPGTVHDAECLCRRGVVRALLTTHRKIMYPLEGGVSVTAITTREPALAEYARPILDYLKWHGLCEVEVKLDARDGKYKLMEINPRLWGKLGLSLRAGIPFPAKACELAVSGDTAPAFDYRVGLHYTTLFPRSVLSARETRKAWRPLGGELLRLFGPHGVSELDLRDPMPHLFDVLNTARMLLPGRGDPEL